MSTCEEQCGDACVEAIQPSCEQACNQACQNMGESCSQQCSEQCNAASQECANELCSGLIEASCQSMCSSENIACESENPNMIAIASTIGLGIGASLFLIFLGIVQSFDPNGPLLTTFFGSSILMINLTGIRIKHKNKDINSVSNSRITQWKFLSFIHSHHNWIEAITGHEFKIKNKYFCVGCYGIMIGTGIALVSSVYYAIYGLHYQLTFILPFIIPLCFVPIVYRYIYTEKASIHLRLFSNILLPIGCCLIYIWIDYTYHSWILNCILVVFALTVAVLRAYMPKKKIEIFF